MDAALAETAHALDTLGADGVVLMSNAHGRYLGDPDFEPLWAELDRRGATVFVHPAQPPMPLLPGTPAPLADYVFDTTRTALNLVLNGVMSRYPNLRVILSHGGGFLPYAAYRFSGLASTVDRERNAEDLLRDLKRFYFDTALSASPSALPALLAFAEPGHVLYGSDWPFAPQDSRHLLQPLPGDLPRLRPRPGRGHRPRQRRGALPPPRPLTRRLAARPPGCLAASPPHRLAASPPHRLTAGMETQATCGPVTSPRAVPSGRCQHGNGIGEPIMDARLNLFGSPLLGTALRHLNSAGKAVTESALPTATQELVKLRASQINGCGFCTDMHTKEVAKAA